MKVEGWFVVEGIGRGSVTGTADASKIQLW